MGFPCNPIPDAPLDLAEGSHRNNGLPRNGHFFKVPVLFL